MQSHVHLGSFCYRAILADDLHCYLKLYVAEHTLMLFSRLKFVVTQSESDYNKFKRHPSQLYSCTYYCDSECIQVRQGL